MSIGIVTDEDFNKELESIEAPLIKPLPTKGRNENDNNVPESLRKIIGEESAINGRQSALQLAQELGISPSSVSAYTKGATSTASYDSPKPTIIDHINKSRRRAIKRASHTLNSALGSITQEKLDYADAKDLSVIARNMSGIIKDLEPPPSPGLDSLNNQPQFVVYAPTFRDERSFDSITVNEID
jgi:predicted transcriptional regulator